MIRILLVHNSADFYGASRSLLRLCTRLKDSEFDAKVLLPCTGPLVEMVRAVGTEVVVFPSLRVITRPVLKSPRMLPWSLGFLPSAVRLARLIQKFGIRLVHTNTGVICSPALAARLAGVPHIWHVRDWFQEFGPLWKPYSRYILALSSRVICVSGAIAAQFPPSAKVSVLHNGFDLADFPPVSEAERQEARSRWQFARDDFVLGVVGRIKFIRKGQEFFLRAIAELRKTYPKVRGLLAGGDPPGAGDQTKKMKALAAELGLSEAVVFAGELQNARPAYAAMDVFVLPSAQPEPFGGVVMEAMSLGLPVIGTAIGGTTEQIADGTTGFLVPPRDPEAIAAAARHLFRDNSLRLRMGKAARERMAANFSLAGMLTRLTSIYTETLSQGTSR